MSHKVIYFIASLCILEIPVEIRANVEIPVELRIFSLSKYCKIKQYEEDKHRVLKSEDVLTQCSLLVVITVIIIIIIQI